MTFEKLETFFEKFQGKQDFIDKNIDNLSSKVDILYPKDNQLVFRIDNVLNRVDQLSTDNTNLQITASQLLVDTCSVNNPISMDQYEICMQEPTQEPNGIIIVFLYALPSFCTIALLRKALIPQRQP